MQAKGKATPKNENSLSVTFIVRRDELNANCKGRNLIRHGNTRVEVPFNLRRILTKLFRFL